MKGGFGVRRPAFAFRTQTGLPPRNPEASFRN